LLGRIRCAAQRTQRDTVGARRTTQSKIDTPWEEPFERPELLGDDIGRMIGQHDATRADADGVRAGGDMGQHHGRRRARDARHVVVFRHPNTVVAPTLRVGGEIPSIVQRAPGIGLLGDRHEFEDGERNVHRSHPCKQNLISSI